MNKKIKGVFLLLVLTCSIASAQTLTSPNGNYQMNFSLSANGAPVYTLTYKGKAVIRPSKLGLELMPEGVKRTFEDFSPDGQKPDKQDIKTNLYNGFEKRNNDSCERNLHYRVKMIQWNADNTDKADLR